MRDYGKVHTTFWTSQNIRSLSEDGRSLAMYLLTCPHGTIAGVFRIPDGYVCDDLQWGSERVTKGFAELFENGFAYRCETTKWVWIYKHIEWNPPENPNQIKAVIKVTKQVPKECIWSNAFIEETAHLLAFPSKPFGNPSETVSKPEAVAVAVSVTETEAVAEAGDIDPPRPSMSGAVCVALKAEGIGSVSPANPKLKELLDAGAEIGLFVDAARAAKERGKASFGYVLAMVKGQLQDSKNTAEKALTVTKPNRQEALEARNLAVAEDFARSLQ